MNAQNTEADELRRKASAAAKAAVHADAEISARLDTCLVQERAQASQDRQGLLTQITNLVNKSGEVQDSRWESKIETIRKDIGSSRLVLQAADIEYNADMDVWSKKESLLVEEVLKSRDALKGKMKDDWKAINEHNTSIQSTTKSVHEETIRIVDAQMKDMATQMQALDDFVTRARSQNERHHSTHVESLGGLASTVRQSYSSIGDHFVSTYDRVREIGKDVSNQSTALQASLLSLSSTIQQPLADLRSSVTGAPLKEYVPTGETPRKTQYQYPTTLPRTQSHDKLLAKAVTSSPRRAQSPTKSPNKSVVYTDVPTNAAPPSPFKEANQTSLREVSMNINAPLMRNHSDSSAHTLSSVGKTDLETVGMGPPPLKRQATMDSKLPTKFGGGKPGTTGVVRLEGRENLGASLGNGRRLRSSPTGLGESR